MALIMCPECSSRISDTAPSCPHCGFVAPRPMGRFVAVRKSQLQAAAQKVQVIVDGLPQGNLAPGQHLALDLPAGDYQVVFSPSMSGDLMGTARVRPGQEHVMHLSHGLMGWKLEG